jgi:PDZ domain-containing protein
VPRFGARRVAAVAVGLVAIAFGVLWFTPSDDYVYLPDRARPVDPLIRVPGEQGGTSEAGIYMVDVSIRKASLLEKLFPAIDSGATLVPASEFLGPGGNEKTQREAARAEMHSSQLAAKAVALEALGYKVVPDGTRVAQVSKGYPADGVLQRGDLILAANGRSARTPDELTSAMSSVEPGRTVRLRVRRAGRTLVLTVGTRQDPDSSGKRAIMGILVEPRLTFPVRIRINAHGVGGPSAGLAFALDIAHELGARFDRARRVAVTGALGLDGDVAPIGGIKQKTIGAKEADADVFIVPRANAAAARRYAGSLPIVPVGTFRQAMSYLTTPPSSG